jgi:signal transduction histidine kinase
MQIELQKCQTSQLEQNKVSMDDVVQKISVTIIGDAGGDVSIEKTAKSPQKERRNLSAQTLMIQENERQRIAKDLHDGLGQSLTLIRLGLEECASLLDENSSSHVRESLGRQRQKVEAAFSELRRIAMDLRPPMIDDLGILATMSWFFRDFGKTCKNIKIEKNILVPENQIPKAIKISIFRILQESFSNIVKYANADRIRVSLVEDSDVLQLSIEDNGQGFDTADNEKSFSLSGGFGLISMKERAILSGGACYINSAIGQGTRIYISWPVR